MTAKIMLCPGQGAQAVGMGKAWYDRSPEARAVFERADKVLGDRLGGPLSKLCFEGPADRLNRTDASQPAIYVTSVACWHALLAAWQAGGGASTNGASGGVGGGGALEAHVVATAGLSLGEYTALHLAGCFSFEDGLELVTLRGRAMQEAADAIRLPDGTPGSGMVALIGADEAQAVALCDAARGPDVLVPANFNCPGQIVVSGSIEACRRAEAAAAGMGFTAKALTVAGAFHSPLMAPAAERLAAALAKTPVKAPRCPVMSNVTGRAHDALPGRTLEDSIRRRLVEQLTAPVRWEADCRTLLAEHAGAAWHELAPGRTLMGMMRRTDRAAKVETHDEP
jgi:[acyl-carrier-protein] S-malonyltransferase